MEEALEFISKFKQFESRPIQTSSMMEIKLQLDHIQSSIFHIMLEVKGVVMKIEEKKDDKGEPKMVKVFYKVKKNTMTTGQETKDYFSTMCTKCESVCHEHCNVPGRILECIANVDGVCKFCGHGMTVHIHSNTGILKFDQILSEGESSVIDYYYMTEKVEKDLRTTQISQKLDDLYKSLRACIAKYKNISNEYIYHTMITYKLQTIEEEYVIAEDIRTKNKLQDLFGVILLHNKLAGLPMPNLMGKDIGKSDFIDNIYRLIL